MNDKTAEFLKQKHTCVQVLKDRGNLPLDRGKNWSFICPFHADKKPSLDVAKDKDLWCCRAGCGGGDVIDLMAKLENLTVRDFLVRRKTDIEIWGANGAPRNDNGILVPNHLADGLTPRKDLVGLKNSIGTKKSVFECAYDYVNADGTMIYQAVRLKDPKDFRQRRPLPNGEWAWDMNGIERVLYHLPEVRKATEVWIVEGEKDADHLRLLGFTATCNVGGAGKWLESYSEHLTGKHLIICGDNDKPGKDHVQLIKSFIVNIAASVRVITVPAPAKDISDHLEGMSDSDAMDACRKLRDACDPLYKGETLPLKTMADLEVIYKSSLELDQDNSMFMGRWLPSLSEIILEPGEMYCIIAETGIGKTSVATNLVLSNTHLRTIYFQQELSDKKVFERNASTGTGFSREEIRKHYKLGSGVDWKNTGKFDHVLTCTESGLQLERIASIARRSELMFGLPIQHLIIDYLQLMRGAKIQSRYERFTDIAEGLRTLAKQLGIVIGIVSQVNRDKERVYQGLSINDAKDSGAIENSSSLMMGFTRNPELQNEMCCQILKATDFGGGSKIFCNYDYKTLRITETARKRD